MNIFKILKNKIVFVCLLAIVLMNFSAFKTSASNSLSVDLNIDSIFDLKDFGNDEKDILKLINKQREKSGLANLNWNTELVKLAQLYSKKMARERFFSHIERNGYGVAERAEALHITNWLKIGENLFMASGVKNLGKFAVDKWMLSSGHRQNILDTQYTDTGIGIAESNDGKIYVTQVFIKR
jgi:uncharacterized protein YkwD